MQVSIRTFEVMQCLISVLCVIAKFLGEFVVLVFSLEEVTCWSCVVSLHLMIKQQTM